MMKGQPFDVHNWRNPNIFR